MAFGGAGRDQLVGDAGNDTLTGNAGLDRLTGGLGADRFVFLSRADSTLAATGRDVITDFNRAQGDKIVLTAIDANTRVAGNQAFDFIGTAAFSGQAGELRVQASGAGRLITGDANGDGVADFAIYLDDPLAVNAGFFDL